MDDAERLARARNGERAAFEQSLRPVVKPAYRLALAMLGDREAAEDAVQEMALKAWRHRSRIRPELGSLRPWLLAIVANECRMARRGRWWSIKRFGLLPDRYLGEADMASTLDLRSAINHLSYNDRLLLHLYFVLDLPMEETARVIGIGVGAAKSRLHRVTKRLRSSLSALEVTT
jgi:RNA polymerase sigma-70 factor (ECF subfamily)